MKKKVLLVGGSGFIGHNLALQLKKRGHQVFVVDSLTVNNLRSPINTEIKNKNLYTTILENRIELLNENEIKLNILDARDNKLVNKYYTEINPDIIVHLAAVSHANKSNKDPHSTFDNSLRTLENTLDYAKNKKTHVIYLSSSMVYGNFKDGEVDENSKCDPIGIYGNLKLSGEMMLKSFNHVFDLPYTIIRPSALYGERCVSRRVGQVFIESAIQNQDIHINGDGEEKLDFTYIKDLVEGLTLCCETEKAKNETFNITFGNARKVNDLVSILKNNFPNTKVIYKEREKFLPKRGTLNNDKAKDLLGFHPSYSLEKGYPLYISWYKNFWDGLK